MKYRNDAIEAIRKLKQRTGELEAENKIYRDMIKYHNNKILKEQLGKEKGR